MSGAGGQGPARDAPAALPPGWKVSDLATLATIAETFAPGDAPRRARLAATAISAGLDPDQVRQIRLILRAFRSSAVGLVLNGRLVGFRDLDSPERERYLRGWATSAIPQRRSAFQALKRLSLFLSYADPRSDDAETNPRLTAIGYVPANEPVTSEPTPIQPFELPERAGEGGDVELECDVVVVGSGAGGGVVAAEVSRAGRSVVVLEAGPFVPESAMPTDELSAFDRLYLDHGLTATWDGRVSILSGSCVGGGTTVNWTTCIPVGPERRHAWAAEHGLEGFDGPEVDEDLRGLEAELGFAPPLAMPPKDGVLLRGAEALGLEAAPTRRDAVGCGDCGSCGFGCRRGAKRSGLRVHLADAWRSGARIVPGARVERVEVAGGRATGVVASLADGQRLRVRATQTVVAAGTLRTPLVLEASGIEHPAVGRNLHLHPVSVVAGRFDERIEMWRGVLQGARSLAFLGGPRADGQGGFVIESAPGHPGLIALAFPWSSAEGHATFMRSLARYAPLIAIVGDEGSGRVRRTAAGGARIDYAPAPADVAALRRGLQAGSRILRAAGADQVLALGTPPAIAEAAELRTDVAFGAYLDRLGRFDFGPNRGTVFSAHQMGTARAGADPATHACDPWGRVRAGTRARGRAGTRAGTVRGLYVADASLFPSSIGVNPMVTVMLLARRVARTVLAEA